MTPWTDRNGTFSPLKATTAALLCLPAVWVAWAFAAGELGGRPIVAAIHETGDWAVRFLLLSLAVTPLRRIANWPQLVLVRRMIGLAALFYALAHLALYVVELNLDIGRVASEIVRRVYLTVGFAALLGLAALGATSTDRAVRRLGRNWARLHLAVHPIAVLALLHFFMQSKLDVSEPTIMAGLYLLAVGIRIAHRAGLPARPPVLAGVAAAAALATVAVELAWFATMTGVQPMLILQANLDFSYMVRPVWWVLGAGLLVALLPLLRPRVARRPRRAGGYRSSREPG
ncbi:MAG: sulfite oxidase heme-binding subunit YedZ [Alphaproteobacteria bacterium]